MIVQPKVRGFICTTAHPEGCKQHVLEQINFVKSQPSWQGPRRVLIIGASTGYGLASRIALAFGARAQTIGVFFERAASGRKTASAGWYNSATFEQEARRAGLYAKSINGDAFSDEVKQQTIELIQQDWQGEVDLVIYSLAAPRRKDPKTGEIYSSVLKPVEHSYLNKTIDAMSGLLGELEIPPATAEEVAQTVKVMGGEDWALWIEALLQARTLSQNVKTLAYSYIGPDLTYPIYRHGTIGVAKEHLEKTAHLLTQKLVPLQGQALVSINKGLVTQASSAIPVVPLYIAMLYKVMKAAGVHEGCIEQMQRLFTNLYTSDYTSMLDEEGRLRLDDYELRADIQAEISRLWSTLKQENIDTHIDLKGYQDDFYKLFGFGFSALNYEEDIDIEAEVLSLLES